jgi:hypothetical protein
MVRVIMSFLGLNTARHSASLSACFHRRFLGSLRTAEKTDLTRQNMKWNASVADKARSLIFGERRYTEFTPQEQRIVDFYQQKKLEEDMVILPNTRAALEQAEVEQMLLKRYKKYIPNVIQE